jgi:C4-dicarboxylate transporter DctQ subunit
MFIINRLEETFIALILAAMTLITFAQIVVRYVNSQFWNSSVGIYLLEQFTWLAWIANIRMGWALELTTYLFAWLVLFGMSYGVRVGAHIGVDAFTKILSPTWQRILALLAITLSMSYCVLLLIGAIKYVYMIYDLGIKAESLPIPQWFAYLILPIGLALLFLRFTQLMVKVFRGTQTQIFADEAEDALAEHKTLSESDTLPSKGNTA